jgi:hypothetical protein
MSDTGAIFTLSISSHHSPAERLFCRGICSVEKDHHILEELARKYWKTHPSWGDSRPKLSPLEQDDRRPFSQAYASRHRPHHSTQSTQVTQQVALCIMQS